MTVRLADCYGCTFPAGHGGHCETCSCPPETTDPNCTRDGVCACHGEVVVCDGCYRPALLEDTTPFYGQDTRQRYNYCGTCLSSWNTASPLEQRYMDGDR